ncbi:hypothetical protein RJ639_011334 [Escallonia herrerae]|uniref:Uncharacterized protein n=1 Tax=Escallonia herrerae TaxID=1293975 RepID=A0AA88VKA0_9ASTE|nr:hypothetical protein RJ639_011334 [Escallonia herrerae]
MPKAKWELSGMACNNKALGARSFLSGNTPVDEDGHRTLTASTAAENFVKDANIFEQAYAWHGTSGSLGHAPRVLTVGAGTIGRSFRATALLGNKDGYSGESVFQPKDFPPQTCSLLFTPE